MIFDVVWASGQALSAVICIQHVNLLLSPHAAKAQCRTRIAERGEQVVVWNTCTDGDDAHRNAQNTEEIDDRR
jgi:hypothetical protein